jgi:hypothetical protein
MISEAQLSVQAQDLLQHYREAYRRRYKTLPITINVGIEQTVLKDVIRAVGLPRAKEIVSHYLTMPGSKEFFLSVGHTLDVLWRNINQVNASLGAGQSSSSGGWNPRIVIDTRCPRCNCDFKLTGDADAVCRDAYIRPCPACEELLAGSAL